MVAIIMKYAMERYAKLVPYLHRFGAGQYFMEIFLAPASCVVRPRNLSEPISLAIQLAGLRLSLANLTQAHHHSAVGWA